MDLNLIEALLYSIIPTFLGTVITLYFTERVKGKVKSGFDEKLERIKRDHNIHISRFQAEISALKEQENFKFTKLHEKRFEVLENIYKLLNFSNSGLESYVSPAKFLPEGVTHDENEDKLYMNFTKAHNEFRNYYSDNKIYLNEKINFLIDSYFNEIGEVFSDYSQNHFLRNMGEKPEAEIHLKAYSAYKKIPSKIIPIKKEIENKFREMLES